MAFALSAFAFSALCGRQCIDAAGWAAGRESGL